MSALDITTIEGQRNAGQSSFIPTIDSFKKRMNYILLNNRYTAEFSGSDFWNEYANVTRYMISSINLPQLVIDPEQVYVGGTNVAMPNGFQQGNLDMIMYNTGPELQVIQRWIALAYDQSARTYGYFDDVKCDLTINQFTVNGDLVQTFKFTDCTPYNMGGISFSYEPSQAPQTFSIALNYYGFSISTNPAYLKLSSLLSDSQQAAAAVKAAAAKTKG